MPITFSIESSTKTVHTWVTGPLLDADPVRYLSDLLAHPAYSPGFSALIVCKDVELGSFSTEAVHRFVHFSGEADRELRGSRVAVVAHQPAVYGLARMYHLLRQPEYEFRVFRELSDAEAWIAGSTRQSENR